MIKTQNLIRWSGAMLVLSGILYFVVLITPGRTLDAYVTAEFTAYMYTLTLHHFLLLFGLFGLFIYQFQKAGLLGLIAFVLLSLATVLGVVIGMIEITVIQPLARNETVQSWIECTVFIQTERTSQGYSTPCTAIEFGPLHTWYGITVLLWLVSNVLLGISIMRAKILSWWGGLLLIVGCIYTIGEFLIPLPVRLLGIAIMGLGYALCGYTMWSYKGQL